jgi:predicted TIM-barrel fold metal-dependent hydrolase
VAAAKQQHQGVIMRTYDATWIAGLLLLSILPAMAAPRGDGPPRSFADNIPTVEKFPWIDVHNHLLPGERHSYADSYKAALAVMDQVGITRMIVMPAPHVAAGYDYAKFVSAFPQYARRFAFFEGGESLNVMLHQADAKVVTDDLKKKFEQKADELIRAGALGFGEIAIRHLSLQGEDHPYENVPGDHPLLLLLADIAARHDVPIDIHLDVATNDIPTPAWLTSPNNPKTLSANLAGFERLLAHNPKARICWAHAGSDNIGHWTTDLSRALLQKHPNLYLSLRLGPGHVPENFPLTQKYQLKPEWLRLLKDFPNRFVIGSDNFFAPPSFQGKGTGAILAQRVPLSRKLAPVFLRELPPDVAQKIATENAIAIYKLRP